MISVYLLCAMRVRTLFTVAKEELMDNAEKEILRFAPAAKVGRIHRDRMEVEGCDFVIAMTQTVLSRAYGHEDFASFGLWIDDEAHHRSARYFATMCESLRCRYRIGLSATPRRKDGLTEHLFWTFGPIFLEIARESGGVECAMVHYEEGDQRELKGRGGTLMVPRMITRLTLDPKRNDAILRRLVWCAAQNDADVLEASGVGEFPWGRTRSAKDQRRKVIVLSERRKHLSHLHEQVAKRMLDAHLKAHGAGCAYLDDSIPNRLRVMCVCSPARPEDEEKSKAHLEKKKGRKRCRKSNAGGEGDGSTRKKRKKGAGAARGRKGGVEEEGGSGDAVDKDGGSASPVNASAAAGEAFSVGFFVGGKDPEEREEAKRCDVIMATYHVADEGLNIPRLDTVFFATPRSDLEQASGRARREHPDKNRVLMVYFWDGFSLFMPQGWKAHRYFANEGWAIRHDPPRSANAQDVAEATRPERRLQQISFVVDKAKGGGFRINDRAGV